MALMLFSVITALLYSGLNLAIKSLSAAEKRSQEVNHVLAIQAFLRTKVASIQWIHNNSLNRTGSFIGERHKLEFVSDVPQSITAGGLAIYQIELSSDPLKPALKVALNNYPKDDPLQSNELQEDVEISEIKQFNLAYFGQLTGEQENSWHQQWADKGRLPLLVKIELETTSGLNWPAQIIALRASN